MNPQHWEILLKVIAGEKTENKQVGFIIDSPWLPGWYNVTALDYYTDSGIWYDANRKAAEEFPEVIFMPGFWSEYGMCTEPSAFGSKLVWTEENLPHPSMIINSHQDFGKLEKPDVTKDGLLPLALRRLVHYEDKIKSIGHHIRFAVSRGPLNIASFLMGTTDFMMALTLSPDDVHKGLTVISDFIADWLNLQAETFQSIDGILILDDMVGFLGEPDFKVYVLPYLKRIYDRFNVKVKFFHNDAEGLVCAPYLEEIGINLYNFSFNHSLGEMRKLAGNQVTLLGNIPPNGVLAAGSPDDIKKSVHNAMDSIDDHSRIIWSCGGGMPPGVSTENLNAFISAVRDNS
ncbi:MAG: hypothetical protein JSV24_04700 [Bacteroidales bacterium]|nr:MAG: hypothetical protein JSV24_04700 [Bacteroidales bacterium]